MTTRNLLSDDGTFQTYAVLDGGGNRIGTDVQPSPGSPLANQGVLVQNLRAGMAAAENALANWATLSAAQKDTAQKAALAGVVRLTRVVLGVLDAAP